MGKKIFAAIFAVATLVSCKKEQREKVLQKVKELPSQVCEFGFDLNAYTVLRDTVKKGDSFGEILQKNQLAYSDIYEIVEHTKDSFDTRRLQVGKPYTILLSKDSLKKPKRFIYQPNKIDYVVINLADSLTAYKEKKRVTEVEKTLSGVINSSLSEALDAKGIDYSIAHDMSDIYAWTIDFFRLQKGDRFKLIYTEKYINDSIYAGVGRIKAAYFEHNKEPFYAFDFQADSLPSVSGYFDDNARNLRRAFLKAPLRFKHVRITSRYNLRRRIKLYGNRIRPHKGTDFAAPIGTPIVATANGTIVESARRGGNGNFVKVKHNATYMTQYLHMKKRAVKKGDYVAQGDVIGWVGMTGNTSGPHVCYRFWKNGKQVDPFKEKLPQVAPLKGGVKTQFLQYMQPLKAQLDAISFSQENTTIVADTALPLQGL